MKEAIIEIQARNEIQAWKGYLTIIVITHKILEIQIVRIRRNQTNLLCFSLKQMKLPRLYQFHVREKISMPGCFKQKPLQCDAPYRGHLTNFVTS